MTKKIDLPGPFTVSSNYKDACLNALIYCWKKEDFRRGLKRPSGGCMEWPRETNIKLMT